MSESDFKDITRNGALCNDRGEIGLREFETIVRTEARRPARKQELLFALNTRLAPALNTRIAFALNGISVLGQMIVLTEARRPARPHELSSH